MPCSLKILLALFALVGETITLAMRTKIKNDQSL